ncbi:hypothetical protein [Paracoccus sp. S1E-3]|uniref:hypothetical protein n=1 Tax=Paracoccus sp. S1E-3 TaxID=2756130 RepID=UPI0015EEDEE2|nr:hypothetical protein [Paracoccus sp. S1E-3]MBA4492026.1 hypothetical protein [Paracoccus sp. S1E-3]
MDVLKSPEAGCKSGRITGLGLRVDSALSARPPRVDETRSPYLLPYLPPPALAHVDFLDLCTRDAREIRRARAGRRVRPQGQPGRLARIVDEPDRFCFSSGS